MGIGASVGSTTPLRDPPLRFRSEILSKKLGSTFDVPGGDGAMRDLNQMSTTAELAMSSVQPSGHMDGHVA